MTKEDTVVLIPTQYNKQIYMQISKLPSLIAALLSSATLLGTQLPSSAQRIYSLKNQDEESESSLPDLKQQAWLQNLENTRNQSLPSPIPSGLVAVVKHSHQYLVSNSDVFNNPYISGIAIQVRWGEIQPNPGAPNWSTLDNIFAAAAASGKWIQIIAIPGFATPEWALEGVQSAQFPVPYGPDHGTIRTLPMPWDTTYLNRWFSFLQQLSSRYGNSSTFKIIAADGPTSISAEMTLPRNREDLQKWMSCSYTPEKFIGAWQSVFQEYSTLFPHQYISLPIGHVLNIDKKGEINPLAGVHTRNEVITLASTIIGRRFVLMNCDLHAGPKEQHEVTDVVINCSGRLITGLQMKCAAEDGSGVMGAEGNPPLALRKSIDKGMVLSPSGQHVNFLEIYAPDVVAPEMQPVLKSAASLFAPPSPAPTQNPSGTPQSYPYPQNHFTDRISP